jgi:hypothetical protein
MHAYEPLAHSLFDLVERIACRHLLFGTRSRGILACLATVNVPKLFTFRG